MNSFIQRLQTLNNRLAQYLTDKGVTTYEDETTTQLVEKVQDIQNGNDDAIKGLIQGSIIDLDIPNGTTFIKACTFQDFPFLTSVTIPNSVLSINISAFQGCESLESITIPNSVTRIDENAFHGCISLASITIPNSVTKIELATFAYCSSLTSITIPDSVTSIDYQAFNDCTGLTSLSIPRSVTTINVHAFDGCCNLENVTVEQGFRASLNISSSTKFTAGTLDNIIKNYVSGMNTVTLTIGTVNKNKLSDETKAIAASRNITLA